MALNNYVPGRARQQNPRAPASRRLQRQNRAFSPAMLASQVAAFSSANSWAAFLVEMEVGSSTCAIWLKWPATVEVVLPSAQNLAVSVCCWVRSEESLRPRRKVSASTVV